MKDKITYTTAGGGTVIWENNAWSCRACGDTANGKWGTPRDANDHARGCQARD